MPDTILGGQGATLLMAIVIVAIALLALVGVFWLIRARSTSTFIRGGKNRQPRLAVLDATAVDTRRRLVLIRRDDVEHLIMIGGPSDIVIESRIVHPADDQGAQPPRAAPAQKAAPQRTDPQPEPMPRPAPGAAAAQRPVPPARPQPQPQPRRPEPVREPELARSPSPPPQPSPSAPASGPAMAAATAAPAAAAAGPVGSIHAEAFEALESARARVFEEPSFDEAAYEELTSAPEPAPRAATAPSPAASYTPGPSSYTPAPSSYTPAPAFERATGSPATPPQAARQPVSPVPGDFESVLAAELSQDLSLDSEGGYFEPLEDELRDVAFEIDRDRAPEVKPDSPPSRDSLEAEMERLLGDLSRKP